MEFIHFNLTRYLQKQGITEQAVFLKRHCQFKKKTQPRLDSSYTDKNKQKKIKLSFSEYLRMTPDKQYLVSNSPLSQTNVSEMKDTEHRTQQNLEKKKINQQKASIYYNPSF